MITTRFTQMFALDYPLMSAPMAMHSGGRLAAAVSKAGALGSFGGIHRSGDPGWVRGEVERIRSDTDRPFGVGFITSFIPMLTPLFDAAVEAKPNVIAFSFGSPGQYADKAKSAGAKVRDPGEDVVWPRVVKGALEIQKAVGLHGDQIIHLHQRDHRFQDELGMLAVCHANIELIEKHDRRVCAWSDAVRNDVLQDGCVVFCPQNADVVAILSDDLACKSNARGFIGGIGHGSDYRPTPELHKREIGLLGLVILCVEIGRIQQDLSLRVDECIGNDIQTSLFAQFIEQVTGTGLDAGLCALGGRAF